MARGRGTAKEVEDDEAALLSTLGVTAANPDDIERTLLAQVSAIVSCVTFSSNRILGLWRAQWLRRNRILLLI